VLKMGRAVPQADLLRHADPVDEFPFESCHVEWSRWSSRSSNAEPVYSTVAKPWLKFRAASRRRNRDTLSERALCGDFGRSPD
jgi:hypothetical protein